MLRSDRFRHRLSPFAEARMAPRAGLMQADCEGQVWLCEAVIRNGDLSDYYLVRLSRIQGSDPVGQPVVLSPSEYASFSLDRRLQDVLL
ncbi:MAG TPA: hypothetical protein VLJ86_16505 [Ramlibacter sp.]|nr:hypothetical protein [Ramlibacter sp.]